MVAISFIDRTCLTNPMVVAASYAWDETRSEVVVMLLKNWFEDFRSRNLSLEESTKATYGFAVSKIDFWKIENVDGRSVDTEDLSVDLVSRWVNYLFREEKLKPRSVNSYRSSINAVWSEAIREKKSPPSDTRLVTSCKVGRTIPIAWSMEDLKLLLAAARAKRGRRKNQWKTLRRDFWFGVMNSTPYSSMTYGILLE